MTLFSAEFFGSALIVLLGTGVVAQVVLKQTKGHAAGWLAINAGWALAVTLGLYAFGAASGGHFNPAVSMAMWLLGKISAAQLPAYLGGQLLGSMVGAIGLSLGGPTGYAINPARDLGPRLVHALLPIAGKGDSQWHYALVPILGPIAGGLIAALIFRSL